jgi:hypothetical protein
MLHIRFDAQRRVVGHWGEIGLDAAENTADWIQANKNRSTKRTKTEQNKSARDLAINSIKF